MGGAMSRLADAAEAVAVVLALTALVGGLVVAASSVRSGAPDDGVRREPPAQVGARVAIDGLGEGVITREVRELYGSAWQVRLDSTGRHVVVYRAQFRVLGGLQSENRPVSD